MITGAMPSTRTKLPDLSLTAAQAHGLYLWFRRRMRGCWVPCEEGGLMSGIVFSNAQSVGNRGWLVGVGQFNGVLEAGEGTI